MSKIVFPSVISVQYSAEVFIANRPTERVIFIRHISKQILMAIVFPSQIEFVLELSCRWLRDRIQEQPLQYRGSGQMYGLDGVSLSMLPKDNLAFDMSH